MFCITTSSGILHISISPIRKASSSLSAKHLDLQTSTKRQTYNILFSFFHVIYFDNIMLLLPYLSKYLLIYFHIVKTFYLHSPSALATRSFVVSHLLSNPLSEYVAPSLSVTSSQCLITALQRKGATN